MINKLKAVAFCLILIGFTITACEYFGGGGRTFETEEGVKETREQLDSKFGKGAWYTDVTLSYDKSTGTVITGTGTADPNSPKLIERHLMKGIWKDLSEITMEISGGGQPKDFMFTLDQVNMDKIPALVKQSKEKVSKEKGIKDVVVTWVSISMPDKLNNDKPAKPSYRLNVEPESGGTHFTFIYDVQGNFENMIY